MTKELRKAIMNRSKLRNKLLKSSNLASSAKVKYIFLGNWTIELSPTIENFGKLSVLSSRRRLFTKNLLF